MNAAAKQQVAAVSACCNEDFPPGMLSSNGEDPGSKEPPRLQMGFSLREGLLISRPSHETPASREHESWHEYVTAFCARLLYAPDRAGWLFEFHSCTRVQTISVPQLQRRKGVGIVLPNSARFCFETLDCEWTFYFVMSRGWLNKVSHAYLLSFFISVLSLRLCVFSDAGQKGS